jgi:hypothetical protein
MILLSSMKAGIICHHNTECFKAACLKMSQNISRKSNLRKMYEDFRKSKLIQDSRNNLHVMYD